MYEAHSFSPCIPTSIFSLYSVYVYTTPGPEKVGDCMEKTPEWNHLQIYFLNPYFTYSRKHITCLKLENIPLKKCFKFDGAAHQKSWDRIMFNSLYHSLLFF